MKLLETCRKNLFLKLLSFVPALLMLCLIFSFSSQTGEESGSLSHEISKIVVTTGNDLFHLELTSEQITSYTDHLEHPIRKLAHMTEYFILTVFVLFPLSVCGLRGSRLIFTAMLFCVFFAATDEFHQSFVAGRGPSVKDVGIDSIGVCFASLFFYLLTRLKKHRKL